MMWLIIIGIIGFILFKFIGDSNKQEDEVTKQGGMKKKYNILINHFLNTDPKIKIIQESSTFIALGAGSIGGSTVIYIQHSFGNVSIEWKTDSPIYGKHKLKWKFEQFSDQEMMLRKIEHDLAVYQSNVLAKFL